jgi:hypothetical protein
LPNSAPLTLLKTESSKSGLIAVQERGFQFHGIKFILF